MNKNFFIIIIFTIISYYNTKSKKKADKENQIEEGKSIFNKEPVNNFNEQWEKTMYDYEPNYVYGIQIKYKTQETYFEKIDTVPARFRGAFLIGEDNEKIDFEIKAPNGEVKYRNTVHECIFDFTVNEIGRYSILFTNRYGNKNIDLTFTANTGQNPLLKKNDLTFTEQKLNSLDSFFDKLSTESKFNRNVHKIRYSSNILY